MAETVSVNLSGPALAFLLYENVKSRHEQEGFLLGDTNEIVTKTITDNDSHNVKRHKIVNINAVIPCPRKCLFYNHSGGVDEKKLELIVQTKKMNVVGWYLYEPYNNFKLTVRAKIIHKQLCNMFSVPPELFSCCMLSSSKSHLESTFTYTHTFIRFYNKQFITVPMHIDNLGEPFNSYKPKVNASKTFLKLCQSLKDPKKNNSDWQSIDNIQDKLHSEVTKTMKQLSLSEEIKGQLEREVEQLRQQIEFQKSILEEKAAAEAEAKANAQNNKNDDDSDNNISLMDIDINKLDNTLNPEDSQESVSSNLNSDLSILNKNSQTNENEKKHRNDKDINNTVNEKVTKNKMISEITRIQKTDEQENILVDTNVGPSTSDTLNNSFGTTNVIDLTLTDEEESNSATQKLSYSQITSSNNTKSKKYTT